MGCRRQWVSGDCWDGQPLRPMYKCKHPHRPCALHCWDPWATSCTSPNPAFPTGKKASQQTGPWHELKVEWNWCSHITTCLVLFRIVCHVAFSTEGANSTDLKLGCDPRGSHPICHTANVVDMALVTTPVRQRGGNNTAKDIALVKCDRLVHLSTTTQMDK